MPVIHGDVELPYVPFPYTSNVHARDVLCIERHDNDTGCARFACWRLAEQVWRLYELGDEFP